MKDLQGIVRDILIAIPETRDSDEVLYMEVLKRKGHEINKETFANYKTYKLPSFASISRARRRVQEVERNNKNIKDWELQSKRTVEKKRRELEKKYRNYYKKLKGRVNICLT